ncbi:MAG: hypothetical protein JWQ87_1285, partial [Candidatus Sulfotelmatobacter sp.]|nr:hypothetical protein [Candidatus Sulfotelmatobacter sp.]
MKTRNIAGLFLCVVMLVVAPKTSWGQNSVLYDDFNQQLLDPLRWATGGACYSSSSEMECVRTIQAGKLLLAHRNFGQQDSDTGNQFGSSTVWFLDPAPIKSITADIVIRNIEEVPCAANSQFGGAVHIDATFFNAGSGNSSDDVGSQLGFSRNSSDPKGQIFVWAQIFQGFNYFGFVSIGHVAAGSTVTATLSWDKANHQFIAKVTNDAGHTTRVTLPYSFSDSAPATNPTK